MQALAHHPCARKTALEVLAPSPACVRERAHDLSIVLASACPPLRAAVTAAALLGAALAFVRLPPSARAIAAVGDAAEPVLLAAVGLYCLVGSAHIHVGGGGGDAPQL